MLCARGIALSTVFSNARSELFSALLSVYLAYPGGPLLLAIL
jgi:hypothetical protein